MLLLFAVIVLLLAAAVVEVVVPFVIFFVIGFVLIYVADGYMAHDLVKLYDYLRAIIDSYL
jgi:hypothetical protein